MIRRFFTLVPRRYLPWVLLMALLLAFLMSSSYEPANVDDDALQVNLTTFPKIVVKERAKFGARQLTAESVSTEPGCKLAQLLLDDPEIAHLYKDPPPLDCHKEEPNWSYIRNATFRLTTFAKENYFNITCRYEALQRGVDDLAPVIVGQSVVVVDGDGIVDDFVRVICKALVKSGKSKVYTNVHAVAAPDEKALKRARSRLSKARAGRLNLNVYMMGFDSVSRMTFMRKLPKTYEYITQNMSGVVLEGYNIVGDGTPQALIPILTGQTEVELPLTRKRYKAANYVNIYPFVWNDFMGKGYVTLYGEDSSGVGTFTYRLKGFKTQPTDHYMRTFYTVVENSEKSRPWCQGSEAHHIVHFRYVEDFFDNYPADVPKFAFQFHSVYSHDNINTVQLADDFMVQHLKFFQMRNYANNSVLIVMSDHGHRFDSLRQTQQGKLEERLPMFAFILPPWFEKRFPKEMAALRSNVKRLTSPFDIYSTLKFILNLGEPQEVKSSRKARSINLFDVVPPERGCTHAGIEPHWCTCLTWSPLAKDNPAAVYIARSLVGAMNKKTSHVRNLCAELVLNAVDKAAKYAPQEKMMTYKRSKDLDGFQPDFVNGTDKFATVSVEHFQVTFRSKPGDAIYEASVKWDKRANELILDLDDVSHINAFGDKPHCIIDQDYFLAKWCVCYDKI